MKKFLLLPVFMFVVTSYVNAQVEPNAGNWKTWFGSGKANRLQQPPSSKDDLAQVLTAQRVLDENGMQRVIYWDAGAPGYRWYSMVSKLWMTDISGNGALAQMLMGTAIYDATVAAW